MAGIFNIQVVEKDKLKLSLLAGLLFIILVSPYFVKFVSDLALKAGLDMFNRTGMFSLTGIVVLAVIFLLVFRFVLIA